MTERQHDPDPDVRPGGVNPGSDVRPGGVNPGYATFQIAKALTTSEKHDDPEVRKRAKEKRLKWETVLRNILTDAVNYGSRTPIEGVPGWATLEVATGGFATGKLLASGPLQKHEEALLGNFPRVQEGEERRVLNAYFLTDVGLAELRDRLRTGYYDINAPEEGALMVVAWLVENGYAEDARQLLVSLSPYFPRLRFYPARAASTIQLTSSFAGRGSHNRDPPAYHTEQTHFGAKGSRRDLASPL